MGSQTNVLLCLALLLASTLCTAGLPSAAQLAKLKLPAGFSISVLPFDLPQARSLAPSGAATKNQIVYVSSKSSRVFALVDTAGNGTYRLVTVLSGIENPNGLAWRKGSLYVSGFAREGTKDIGMIRRYDRIDEYTMSVLDGKTTNLTWAYVTKELPTDRHHGSRYMRFGPDGKLYLNIGAPCNVCDQPPFKASATSPSVPYSSIIRVNVATGAIEPVAIGVRNAVGIVFHPASRAMWFTNNGRDMMGNNMPDDYLAVVNNPDKVTTPVFFGFPWCHPVGEGDPYLRNINTIVPANDPDMNQNGAKMNCSSPTSWTRPTQALGPHVAPLGMWIYTFGRNKSGPGKPGLPQAYDGRMFVAEHGSWNRQPPIGYRVMSVTTTKPPAAPAANAHEEFISGWLEPNGNSWGRPVDVTQTKDGALLISDDAANCVYRVTYRAP